VHARGLGSTGFPATSSDASQPDRQFSLPLLLVGASAMLPSFQVASLTYIKARLNPETSAWQESIAP